jgi:glycosyltransferase involved in cell wall biosynthesis
MTPSSRLTAHRSYTIVHTESSLGWGGQERRIFAEADIMQQRGHRVILAVDPRGELYPRSLQAGLTVHPLPFGGGRTLAAVLTLRRLLRQEQVEVLNTHSSLDSWVGLGAVLGRRSRTRLVRTRHLSTLIKTSWPTRKLYQSPDAIITTGQAIKDLIVARVQVRAAKIFSIPTGVPLDRFYPRPPGPRSDFLPDWPLDSCLIGSVAVLRSWKGHLYLLEALQKVLQAGANARLVLVGEGPYRVVLEAKIADLNLAGFVHLAGYQDNVPDWLALLDLVVLASYANEGVPQSLLQAMALARPVVGTTCGGIPEIVVPGVNGLLVPPKDSDALAQALLDLIRDPATREKFGAQGLNLVQEHYSLEQMAAATEQVYAGIVLSDMKRQPCGRY